MAEIHCLDKLPSLHHAIDSWYNTHGRRELPWRNTVDPYHIYVSEIMLQQTQVQTVLDRFYFPFLDRFPSLKELARAPIEDVTKLWQGLGYYNRAHNLHKAAQLCSPSLPSSIEELMNLPGIGKNTAHAICAFAYHHPVPVMEANLKRVLSRFFALTNASDNYLWDLAYLLVNRDSPFNYNQAMMDIGATICTKANPSCLLCPLQTSCLGKDSPLKYPEAKAKKKTPVRKKNIIVLHDDGTHFFMTKRSTRFLHGLYHFIEYDRHVTHYSVRNYQHPLTEEFCIGHVQQTYSHFILDANIYLIPNNNCVIDDSVMQGTIDELESLPMSMAETKILKLLKTVDSKYYTTALA